MAEQRGFWYCLGSGFVLGLAMIVPGVSGGVLAMALGLYEPMVAAIAKPWENWRGHLKFFLPLGLGAGVCVLLFSRILEFFFAHYPRPTLYFFIGLVLAGLPAVYRAANAQGFGFSHGLSFAAAVLLPLAVSWLPAAEGSAWARLGLWGHVLKGGIVGAGLVIPGLSVSMLLLALGVYRELLGAVAQLDLGILLPAAVGFVPGLLLAAKGMNWLLGKGFGQVYYAILGLMIGSLAAAFPGFPRWGLEWLLCLVLFGAGALIASFFHRNN